MFIIQVFILTLLVLHPVPASAADQKLEQDGISVKVLGQSGKISISSNSTKNNDVVMEMDAIQEYQDTTMVGKTGKEKHSFNTFANQQFEFTDIKSKVYQNLSANGFDFNSTIGNAIITVAVTIFKEAGYIVNDNEEIEVKKGMVKTDISISNWTFCNPCKAGNKDEFGNNLQFTITIKGKSEAPKIKRTKNATKGGRVKGISYDLGANASLILSKKYKTDGVWKDMENGYPKLVTKGPKKSFVFRFEKFNSTVFYDPAVEFSQRNGDIDGDGDDDDDNKGSAADQKLEQDGISVNVLGKSGKISISSNSTKNNDVVMEMDAIQEYQDTTLVGRTGKEKHSFNTFANQEFEFTDIKSKVYQNLSASGFDFKSTIGNATITVAVTIFKEAGYIVNDNEEIEVKKGMVKTDISISNWTFCNPCKAGNKDEFGNNLQFTLTIKGKSEAPKMKRTKNATKGGRVKGVSYDLGANASLILSKKYKADGVWKDMESGYPKLVTKGPKKSFVFRFEKFNSTVFYDPAVEFSQSDSDGDGGDGGNGGDGGGGNGKDDNAGRITKVSGFFVILAVFISRICI